MVNDNFNIIQNRRTLYLDEFLVWCLAFWPLFWNVWGIFRITSLLGSSIPMYVLWGITASFLLTKKRIKVSFLLTWLVFLCVVSLESITRPSAVVMDLSVILCGILFCLIIKDQKFNYHIMLKCFVICGLITSVSVVFDNIFGLFNDYLINLYTEEAASVKSDLAASGGLLSHTGSAGCFIYTGLAAYITLIKNERRNAHSITSILVTIAFLISALLIQKRGFILDTVVSLIVIKVLQIRIENFRAINVNRMIKRALASVVIIVIFFMIFYQVQLIHDAIVSLLDRFIENDDFLSGRTSLYALALSLVEGQEILGIGWGNYRIKTMGLFGIVDKTYAVHNVYLQLYCETGVIGLVAFLIAACSTIVYSIKKYRMLIKDRKDSEEKRIVELGLFIQLFFLSYCMSGNPLYDYNFCIIYFIGIMMTLIPIGTEQSKICV